MGDRESDLRSTEAAASIRLWQSTPCENLDRTYVPPRVRLLETEDPLIGRRVELCQGESFTFVYCGCETLCQCYDQFDEIAWPLIIACDAGLRYPNTPGAMSSIGVYFGKDHAGKGSPLNVSELLPIMDKKMTTVRAELTAALRALSDFKLLKEADVLPGVKEVVLKTDCTSVSDAMTKAIHEWRRNGWLKVDLRAPPSDRDLLWQLEEAVVELYNDFGVAVRFYWVPRKHNGEADRLACQALAEEDSRREAERAAKQSDEAKKRSRESRESDGEEGQPERKRLRVAGAESMLGFIGPVRPVQNSISLAAARFTAVSRGYSRRDSAVVEAAQAGTAPKHSAEMLSGQQKSRDYSELYELLQ